MAAFLQVQNLVKTFGQTTVVKGVSFAFDKGEFISLLGPSGCGKTTILRMIAGFETPSSGTIEVDGRDITHLKPNQRQLGMVFQAYALFPNLNVGDNIGFGLKVAGVPRDERRARITDMLKLIGLSGYENRFPYEMSGGQQQRVALARAIAPRPRLLLLDEPLSALDAKIRVSLREEIRSIQRELGITTVFVTHDQEEALSISDRIVVMNAGNIEQLGTPHEIYNRPASRFAATFVGHLNTLPAATFGPERAIRPEPLSAELWTSAFLDPCSACGWTWTGHQSASTPSMPTPSRREGATRSRCIWPQGTFSPSVRDPDMELSPPRSALPFVV
jgi:putative spermidine/putrescine transport system ATP-binding protein